MEKILIIGANFINKGAQSMLFITMDEIRKRYPTAEIYFSTFETEVDFSNYRFHPVYSRPESVKIAIEPRKAYREVWIVRMKNLCKLALGKKYRKCILPINRLNELHSIMSEMTMMIDISGYGLGAKWGVKGSEQYLDNVRLAFKYNIPIVLMPQSFGPFDYKEDKDRLCNEIQKWLKYPRIIFAREKQGYAFLTDDMRLNNVRQTYDLVLQNRGIDLANIFCHTPEMKTIPVGEKNYVAIIPNVQCFTHGNGEFNMQLYRSIVEKLVVLGKNIDLISHASEDHHLCEKIKNLFPNEEKIRCIQEDFSCLEYDKLVQKYEFVVCSRFHGIVHAYRNTIPCIILGWAIKYEELASCVNQSDFCFDITKMNSEQQKDVIRQVEKMAKTFAEERKRISFELSKIQQHNCFDIAFDKVGEKICQDRAH